MSETPSPEAKPAPGGINKVTLIAGVVVAALASGGGTYLATHRAAEPAATEAGEKGKDKAHPKKAAAGASEEEGAEEEEGGANDEEGEAHVVTLPSFLVNLGDDTQEMHYLKVTIALEAPTEEAAKQLESRGPKVRNNVLLYLSSLKIEDTQGNEKRQQILKRIRAEVRHLVSSKMCHGVYMTEFVVQ